MGMAVVTDALSVLVVDEDPEILAFFARMLDMNGMRALLARTPDEAVGIAARGYVPIDLVLTDVSLKTERGTPDAGSGSVLVERVRELRPEVRALYMSAYVDSEIIRIEMKDGAFETASNNLDHRGLLEVIRSAAATPLVYRMGSSSGAMLP
jgi:DNA-binding NtrC family response regulator